ncbi:MAG: pirin family protein [Bacteroidetes bacterium]|nr:pirin family protein [Bacteroidota bacterium]
MSNIGLIIEERPTQIGNFLVGRLLPFRQKRMVGPFIFIDHMGPAVLEEGSHLDVPPHPHIGLSTLTYLFEGMVLHRDSLGTEREIAPGAVNWMTAGRGIVHSERTPARLRNTRQSFHGLQIWVAMPRDQEQTAPSFTHVEADELPAWEHHGVRCRLIAGSVMGHTSPVPVYSPLYMLELHSPGHSVADLSHQLYGESGLYILEGSVQSEGHTFGPRQILVAADARLCTFEMTPGSTVFLFGGEPFPEERFIHWNFVSSDKAVIEQAKADWYHDRFPKVPGETERVPLPNYP